MNVARLQRIRDHVAATPDVFDMDDWVGRCGTVCCFGGHAALDAGYIVVRTSPRPDTFAVYYDITAAGLASAPHVTWFNTDPMFAAALELSKAQADRLFYIDGWPKDFRELFQKAETAAARATIAAKRIDRFIGSGGLN